MPPPKDKPNPLAAPGDDFTSMLRSEPYPFIDPLKANLQGRCVFVCGASKGIGRAIAVSYAKAGASCIAVGARSDLFDTAKAIQEAVLVVKRSPAKVLQIQINITDPQSVDSAAQLVKKTFGQLDILVHNAGVMSAAAPIADSDPKLWWNTWDVNVRGAYLVTRGFLPLLLQGGDKQIVYVTSVGAWLKGPGFSAYQTSKLALSRFTEFVDAEYSDKGVVAFSVHPGNVPGTDIFGPGGAPEAVKHVFTETPELSADTIVYLTTEKRAWLSGRYISSTWDMEEFTAKKDEVVKGDKLKAKMVL